jgi:anaerobic selenocysteine-containing dehydrogenase
VQQIVNLLLLRGNIGRRGAGIVPVAGTQTFKVIAP